MIRACFRAGNRGSAGGTGRATWGCVGRWNAGTWHSRGADAYVARVQRALQDKPWLQWQ